jgi:hypothetical protein
MKNIKNLKDILCRIIKAIKKIKNFNKVLTPNNHNCQNLQQVILKILI